MNETVNIAEFSLGVSRLAAVGLNVFASVRVHSLPVDLTAPLNEILTEMSTDASLILVGHGGRSLWENFTPPLDSSTHPIDTFSIGEMQKFCAAAFPGVKAALAFPHPGILLPLQKIGRHLNLARPSRLGLDIHREFGPWFAYRVAVVVDHAIPEIRPAEFESPCVSCAEKPCATACPSGAIGTTIQLNVCADYRLSDKSSCEDRCHARLACPVGAGHRYDIEQIQYHMLRPEHLRRLRAYSPTYLKK